MRWGSEVEVQLHKLCIGSSATLLDALRVIEEGAESIAFVVNEEARVIGSLSDGDVRRAILGGATLESCCLPRVMRSDFAYVGPTAGRAEVLDIMRARDIGQLPVLDEERRLRGLHTIGQIISTGRRGNSAVILAGGRGTRLHPITETVPKPMVTVAGRPILERLVLHLMSHGIRKFHLSVNYLAHVIEDYFGDGSRFGCEIEYLRETHPLGTGGPLSLLDPAPNLPVVVMNGDLVTQCDVGRMLDFHEAGEYVATMGLKPYSVQVPFGVARVEEDRVLEVREKPTERMLINAGIYIFSPATVRRVPRGREVPITDVVGECLSDGLRVGAYVLEDEWLDVGRPEELRRANGHE
jgi:dTDP-glucose pyrophosphorylase/predicted transcriptional regulator